MKIMLTTLVDNLKLNFALINVIMHFPYVRKTHNSNFEKSSYEDDVNNNCCLFKIDFGTYKEIMHFPYLFYHKNTRE